MWEPAVERWDFPRGVAGLSVLAAFAQSRGLAGLMQPQAPAGADGLVTAEEELRQLRALATALRDEVGPGLELGRTYHLTTFGILGYALLSSRTVREVFELTLRFLDLTHMFSRPVVAVGDSAVTVRLEPVVGEREDPALVRFVVERDLAAIVTVLGELVPGGVPLEAVDLAFSRPVDTGPYVAAFGIEPRFGTELSALHFRAGVLDLALPQGNPHSAALAESMCREVVAARRSPPGLADEVRVWIAAHLAVGADAAGAARALALSERTLRRRLADSGTRFQTLLDEVRRGLAEEMLATGVLTVDDVAQRLGYAEASSFIHAFRRWTGQTPAAFRSVSGARTAGAGSAG